MNRIESVKNALKLIHQAANSPELLEELDREFGTNFFQALSMTEIVMKRIIENYPDRIYAALRAGECIIKFIKVDGTIRTARATKYIKGSIGQTCASAVPVVVGMGNRDQIIYWDLDKKATRSFNINRLESIEVVT